MCGQADPLKKQNKKETPCTVSRREWNTRVRLINGCANSDHTSLIFDSPVSFNAPTPAETLLLRSKGAQNWQCYEYRPYRLNRSESSESHRCRCVQMQKQVQTFLHKHYVHTLCVLGLDLGTLPRGTKVCCCFLMSKACHGRWPAVTRCGGELSRTAAFVTSSSSFPKVHFRIWRILTGIRALDFLFWSRSADFIEAVCFDVITWQLPLVQQSQDAFCVSWIAPPRHDIITSTWSAWSLLFSPCQWCHTLRSNVGSIQCCCC